MKRFTAYVSGKVQKVGYRGRVVDIARAFGLRGMVENLLDGRVKIIAEGDDEKLKWFESAINIKNSLIQVSSIEKDCSPAIGEFNDFYKLVDKGETDARLDIAAVHLSELIDAVNNMSSSLGGKIDEMNENLSCKIDCMSENLGNKIDKMNENLEDKIDRMNENLSGKIDKMNENLSGKIYRMLTKQDELLVEVKDMNTILSNDRMDRVLDRTDVMELKNDMADIKAALRSKGII